MEKLQRWLRERCEENNLTWREASIKADLNAGAVSAILSGQRPGLETCKKLARLFRVSVIDVLYWAGHVERFPANDPILYDDRVQDILNIWAMLAEIGYERGLDAIHKIALAFKDTLEAKRKPPEDPP